MIDRPGQRAVRRCLDFATALLRRLDNQSVSRVPESSGQTHAPRYPPTADVACRAHVLGTLMPPRCSESAVVTATNKFGIGASLIAGCAPRPIQEPWHEVIELGTWIRDVERCNDHHEHLEQLEARRG